MTYYPRNKQNKEDIKWYDDVMGLPAVYDTKLIKEVVREHMKRKEEINELINWAQALVNRGYKE